MAEQNYTLADVKKFLKDQLNYYWFYDIFDYDNILFRKAKIEDFNNSKSKHISVMKNMDKQKKINFKTIEFVDCWITVNNNKFIVADCGDYSQKWQEFLEKKYNDAYEHSNS